MRAQDFHDALRNFQSFGSKEAYFGKTLTIGKAASLAMHLRGIPYISGYDSLVYIGSSLGITFTELDRVLKELQEVDFVRIVQDDPTDTSTIRRLDVRVPVFSNAYADLGQRLAELKPTEIEAAGISTLDELISSPKDYESLENIGLDRKRLAIMTDVMGSAQLMRIQPVSGKRIAFSPLAIDANPAAYLTWATKYKDDVAPLLRVLMENQGLPLNDDLIKESVALEEAVLTGVLIPVRIKGATGEQSFVFAPRGGLSETERVVMEKARAILACVRYGQRFAAGAPIKWPRAILRQLREHKEFSKSHPDLRTQYSLLVERGIGRIEEPRPGRFNFHIYDTAENMQALDITIDMLEIGESPSAKIDTRAQAALLSAHGFSNAVTSRPVLAPLMTVSDDTMTDMVRKLSNLARGI